MGRLLVVDWVPPLPDGRPALVNFVFDGGVLAQGWAEQHVRVAAGEIEAWRWATLQEAAELVVPRLRRRLEQCSRMLGSGETAYLHHGREGLSS